MSTHVKWNVDDCPDAQGFDTIRPADESENGNTDSDPIATVYDEANARLIAAAPEMLEALKEAVSSLEWATMVIGDIPEKSKFAQNIVDARAAIAKAEGR